MPNTGEFSNWSPKSVAAFVNVESGSVPGDGVALLSEQIQKLGMEADVFPVKHSALADQTIAAAAGPHDAIVVWGGDGTAKAVLTRAAPFGKPVGLLPGGTMNLVHKRIDGFDPDWRVMLGLLSEGEARPLTAGSANGEPFFVAAMAGRLTRLAEPRELARDGQLIEAVTALANNDALDLKSRLHIEMTGKVPPLAKATTAIAAFVETDPVELFDIGAIDPDSLADLTGTAISAVLQGWQNADGMARRRASELIIESADGEDIELQLDGEPAPRTTSVRIQRATHEPLVFMRPGSAHA